MVEPLRYCADDDRREGDADVDAREGEDRGGVTPCREFMEALRSKLGVDVRASRVLMAEGLLWGNGLREGSLPFGDGL